MESHTNAKDVTNPHQARCRLAPGWTRHGMDGIVHVVVSPFGTDVLDL
jgi:hypothetical protein